MRRKLPFLHLPVDNWVAQTHYMTRLKRGTYFDLLLLMWGSPECRVPNNDAWLGERLRMTPEEVATELRPLIEGFFQSTGNWLTHEWLSEQHLRAVALSTRQSVRANLRWGNNKNDALSESESESESELESESEAQSESEKRNSRTKESNNSGDAKITEFPPSRRRELR